MEKNKKDTEVKKGTAITSVNLVVLIIVISFISGFGSAWLFNKRLTKRIVVVDVEKVVNKRKEEFTKKYSQRDIEEETTKNEMSRDIKEFAERLEGVLSEESNNKIILSKGSAVSNLDDITDSVINQIWEK
jgi:hypothetical protein